ncbi:MAG: cobalamin biosynthesis protein P47K [Deltaproteobacteria bacterium]|jgi:G3E family GTPase|nr:cobalamin biosynthesis protein P47K [Deltaproteobacteria bacterium]
MRVILFSGFLGSGKTTVLLNLAEFVARGEGPGKVVIIENEIGDVDVDGKLLSGSSFETRNLTSGCICCTLSGEFVSALKDIEENLKPNWILIEATGLAHQTIVDTIRYNFRDDPLTNVVIVDAERWDELYESIPFLLTAQVERADLILINKIDCVDETELNHIVADVSELNSEAPLIRISASTDKLDDVWEKVIINDEK